MKSVNKYEVVVIMTSDSNQDEQKALFQKNKGIIESTGGKIFSLDTWGKRNLANEVNKQRKGIYFHSFFEAGPSAILELERTMRINEKVLRFMHTRLDNRLELSSQMETFKRGLAESAQREKEREAKAAARKAAAAAAGA